MAHLDTILETPDYQLLTMLDHDANNGDPTFGYYCNHCDQFELQIQSQADVAYAWLTHQGKCTYKGQGFDQSRIEVYGEGDLMRYQRCDNCTHWNKIYARHGRDFECWECDAQYNAWGQRLRNNWSRNPSCYDDEIGDMEGYELAY